MIYSSIDTILVFHNHKVSPSTLLRASFFLYKRVFHQVLSHQYNQLLKHHGTTLPRKLHFSYILKSLYIPHPSPNSISIHRPLHLEKHIPSQKSTSPVPANRLNQIMFHIFDVMNSSEYNILK